MEEQSLKAQSISNQNDDIRCDLFISKLLERMPNDVSDSFSEKQLSYLKTAIGARSWGQHRIDLRGTIGLFHWRYYFVFLFGRNRRELSRLENQLTLWGKAVFLTLFLSISTVLGVVILYLLKSAAGIDIFPNFSFGLWGWFKGEFL